MQINVTAYSDNLRGQFLSEGLSLADSMRYAAFSLADDVQLVRPLQRLGGTR